MRGSRVRSHRGLLAAGAALAVAGTVAGVGVAGAAEEDALVDANVYSKESGGNCFSTSATGECVPNESADVAIETGQTVSWHFDGNAQFHNAADATNPSDPVWTVPADGSFVNSGTYSRTFNQPGVYPFFCQAHPNMVGTVTVTGDPVTPTPTASPTSTATPPPPGATATPTPTPTPDDHTNTPPPSGGSDNDRPRIARVKVRGLRRAARVQFWLSEPASVTIRVKRKRTTIRSVRVQSPAGTRRVTVRSRRLKKGRYTVELSARDAAGNRSTLARKSLRLRR